MMMWWVCMHVYAYMCMQYVRAHQQQYNHNIIAKKLGIAENSNKTKIFASKKTYLCIYGRKGKQCKNNRVISMNLLKSCDEI